MIWLFLIVGAYLLGSIPFGVVIAKVRGVNIRECGSGNIGATNVGRVLGKQLGLLCFVLDLSKGAVPVLVAGSWYGILDEWATEIPARTSWLWLAVGVAPVVGHMASVFLRFRGGKGVATAFGALLAMWPTLGIPAVIAFAAWLLVVGISRIVSLASMVAAVTVPIVTILLLLTAPVPESVADLLLLAAQEGESVAATEMTARMAPPIIVSIAIASLVLWRHRANLRRLLSGDEPRVGQQ